MFSQIRIAVLLASALALTVALYYLDSDTPSDDLWQHAAVFGIVLALTTIVYAAVFGLVREFRRSRNS